MPGNPDMTLTDPIVPSSSSPPCVMQTRPADVVRPMIDGERLKRPGSLRRHFRICVEAQLFRDTVGSARRYKIFVSDLLERTFRLRADVSV